MTYDELRYVVNNARMYSQQKFGAEERALIRLVRIVPSMLGVQLAFCAPDLVPFNKVWSPEEHEYWLKRMEKWAN